MTEKKYTTRPDDKAPRKKKFQIYISLVAIVIVAVLLLVLAVPAMTDVEKKGGSPQTAAELEVGDTVKRIVQDVESFSYNNATEIICSSRGEDISVLEDELNTNIDDFLKTSQYDAYPHIIQGTKISIKRTGRLKLTVEEGLAPVLVPSYHVNPENIGTGKNQTIDCRIPLTRQNIPAPVFLKISGSIKATLRDISGVLQSEHNHSFERRLPYPLPFIEASQDLFAREGNGRESMMARMVNYMLTTVGRYRLSLGVEYGMDANESPRNILNEGDVELAVNLAVILWEMKVFSSYDQASVEAVDQYFFNASDTASRSRQDSYNPTGRRTWGEGETQNYIEKYFPARQSTNFLGRTLGSLITDYCFRGILDPGDIIALYLCLDHQPVPYSMLLEPNDLLSILYEKSLFNSRFSDDYFDVVNQEVFLNLSPERSLEFKTTSPNRTEDYKEELRIDQKPDYLIAGRDIKIEGIYPPKGWFTNVVMICEEYLWKPDRSSAGGSRCALYPPGQRPPNHDFRFYWDMDISIDFDLSVSEKRDTYHDAYVDSGCKVNRHVEMSFPVQIYLFWDTDLPKNDAVAMENLNSGGMRFYSNGSTYWYITNESDAMEYMSKHMWQNLRPYNSLNLDELVAIEGALHATDRTDATSVSGFSKILADTLFWKGQTTSGLFNSYAPKGNTNFDQTPYYNMYRFVNWYLLYWKITTNDLKPMILDGLNVTADFNEPSDTLTIFIRHPSATFTLIVENLRNNATRDITLITQINVNDLDLLVTYRPFHSAKPQISKAMLGNLNLKAYFDPVDLTSAVSLDPVTAVTTSIAVELPGMVYEKKGRAMDSRLIIPAGSLDEQTLQDLVDEHPIPLGTTDFSVLLDSIMNEAENDLENLAGSNFYPIGFEDTGSGYSLRIMLNTSGLSEFQAENARVQLLDWAAGDGARVLYMLGSEIGSVEAYRALLKTKLDQYILDNIIFIVTKPYSTDHMFSIQLEPGIKEFILIPEGFYTSDLSQSPALLYGIGTEGERFAAPATTNIRKGQFIKGDAQVISGVIAY